MIEQEILVNKLSVSQIAVKYSVSRDTVERRLNSATRAVVAKKAPAVPEAPKEDYCMSEAAMDASASDGGSR
jgi:transposase